MRDQKELLGLHNSSPITNNLKSAGDNLTKTQPVYTMDGLVVENRWAWIKRNIGSIWRGRYKPYPTYTDPATNNGIFKILKEKGSSVTIAILADWASDTAESQLIAKQAGIQDYSIHLGDTYYVGNDQEIAENFNTDENGTWPYGTLGSFALPGNHEMYSSGKSFFTQLLPFMGSYQGNESKPVQPQQASFFCLENDYWRLIGLDTGYDSLTGFFGLNPNQHLDLMPQLKDWLQNTVNLSGDNRGIILLSHHQVYSAFEAEFPNPANFIASLIAPERDLLWLWGHEHWLAVYGPNQIPNGSRVFGRCIGNSGMPVELAANGGLVKPKNPNKVTDPANRNLVIYDQRQRELVDGTIPLGHNGYEVLTLSQNQLTISYFDDNGGSGAGRKILEETWNIDAATGKLTGESITDLTIDGDQPAALQLSLFGNQLSDAITA